MATNYRDPKVTTTRDNKSGMGKWLAIAAAVILALIVLWWLLGSGQEVETVQPIEPVAPATEQPADGAVVVPAEPVAPAN